MSPDSTGKLECAVIVFADEKALRIVTDLKFRIYRRVRVSGLGRLGVRNFMMPAGCWCEFDKIVSNVSDWPRAAGGHWQSVTHDPLYAGSQVCVSS